MKKIIRTELRTVKEFPSDLEGRINAITNIINTETKQILLAFCLDDRPKSRYELRNEFKTITGSGHWAPTVKGYLSETLVPIGTVAEEYIFYSGSNTPNFGWRITEAGEYYGKPLAAYAMKWAVDNSISLYDIFGPTNSKGGTRAPFNRFQIICFLEDKVLRTIDLSNLLRLDAPNIRQHLKSLEKVGIVNYESVSSEENGWAVYKWKRGKNPEDAKTVRSRPTLTKKIVEYLIQNGEGNQKSISKKIGCDSITSSHILSGLYNQGFLEANFIGRKIQSKASLTAFGKKVKEELLGRIKYALQNENELTLMKKIHAQFMEDLDMLREYAGKAVDLYEMVSPSKNKKTIEEQNIGIINFVRNYQEREGIGPRANEIQEMIGIKGGFSAPYLSPLVEAGKLKKYKEGRAVRYEIAENN